MLSDAGILAYFMPGTQEWILILVIGLLLFGRNLPQVGRQVGRTVNDLRRSVDSFKRELDLDSTMTDARSSVREIRDAVHSTKSVADPKRVFDDLTDEARAAGGPGLSAPPGPGSSGPSSDS